MDLTFWQLLTSLKEIVKKSFVRLLNFKLSFPQKPKDETGFDLTNKKTMTKTNTTANTNTNTNKTFDLRLDT